MSISKFMEHHYRHFNAAVVVDAAQAYDRLIQDGGKMFLAMAGAMSTAELGLSLAEMIRADKVHAISCTGANLEEDLFNLVAHDHYIRVPHYRDLSPDEERALLDRGLNRVTDTCIPEEEAMRRVEREVLAAWKAADRDGRRLFPHEFLYELIRHGTFKDRYQIDPAHSWLVAAAEKNLPLFVPGWEDSSLGNVFAAFCMAGEIKNPNTIRGGIEYMMALADWYMTQTMGVDAREGLGDLNAIYAGEAPAAEACEPAGGGSQVGFFQIGGGIAGDFPICVVPLLHQDMRLNCPFWAYFCQISDSTTSYGSYSGAVPNEKITWGKLDERTPKFVIESDATIVAPLIFARVLGW